MTKRTITPELIQSLDYYSKCLLAEYLHIVNPTKIEIDGVVELDDLNNITSIIEANVK